jgi:hypothetical protein
MTLSHVARVESKLAHLRRRIREFQKALPIHDQLDKSEINNFVLQ